MNHPSKTRPASGTGWKARLDIAVGLAGDQTHLTHLEHFGPLRVQKPFPQEDGSLHIYILHPPGGLVGGDDLEVTITAGKRTHGLFTSPSAGKFYRWLDDARAQQMSVTLGVAEDAHLEWLPQ